MKEQISDMVILNLLLQQGTPTNVKHAYIYIYINKNIYA
jgi:hypothetical protein